MFPVGYLMGGQWSRPGDKKMQKYSNQNKTQKCKWWRLAKFQDWFQILCSQNKPMNAVFQRNRVSEIIELFEKLDLDSKFKGCRYFVIRIDVCVFYWIHDGIYFGFRFRWDCVWIVSMGSVRIEFGYYFDWSWIRFELDLVLFRYDLD